ncbi:TetR/AcrR family transcriptional regulator [Paenibacillus sp. EKM202P]|uniref:TetR/AcrR family transcriptional regulator n=1 Tax=unclassified Paenibacillus TaxID=185978 RepID=UPI0013EA402A|nr:MULTISPECIES: TetR/AcrR family transcriptional regulator [unclassified Paenibacillus]KAF6560061.1 TetR/AcrR family transcriptional regulator [Paenibacillus sp. EKM202P]KAF6564835.1 TetR/AcrR family transcriptional regulator [Paenibacillus sp. EKM207P]
MNIKKNTVQEIMDIGLTLVQERGYNGFSYADIAEAIGIRKASIHYHFPSKQDLVQAVLNRYRREFMDKLQQINDQPLSWRQKIQSFFLLYREPLENNTKLCLCSMMAAELNSFPIEIRDELNLFFDANTLWVKNVLDQGKSAGEFTFSNAALEQAKILIAFVQGAQLLSRTSSEKGYFDSLVLNYMATLTQ